MKIRLAQSLGLLVLLSTNAQASIISGYGMEAATSTASNCPVACTTANGGDFQYDSAGGEFSTTASSSQNSYGSASASAIYTGSTTTYLPILNVNTSSDVGKGAFAEAFGVQGYTYFGADKTIQIDVNLHGSVADNASGYASNQLRADVAVVASSTLEWFSDYATLVYEIALPGAVVGDQSLFIFDGLNQDVSRSILFNVTSGMDFYVIASMGASAQNGFADASNTLTMQFVDDSGLTAVSVSAIPVPGAVWLFGSGLLGLVGVSRRK